MSQLAAWFAQNMRESSSDHKEAPVYLAVMSADPCEPGNPTQLPVNQTGPGKKSSSRSSNNDSVGEILRHPSSDLLDSRAQDENTKSAFEITSVSPFDAEDLELSMQHPKGMSGSFVEDQKLRGQSESSESDEKAKVPLTDFAKDTTVQEHISESNEKFVPLEGASNGPVVASVPRRFRLVNKYERGRWVIEDTSEPREMEERPESELKGAYTTNQNSKGSVANTLVGRDSPSSQRKRGEERVGDEVVQLHSRSNSDLGGQGLDTASTGERESHVDRSSVVGETASNLSRNTSLSSLTTAGDKSVDGDHSSDQLSQLKDESETEITYPATLTRAISTSAGTSAQPAVSSPPLQHRHGEATLPSTSINAANTSDSGGEESQ